MNQVGPLRIAPLPAETTWSLLGRVAARYGMSATDLRTAWEWRNHPPRSPGTGGMRPDAEVLLDPAGQNLLTAMCRTHPSTLQRALPTWTNNPALFTTPVTDERPRGRWQSGAAAHGPVVALEAPLSYMSMRSPLVLPKPPGMTVPCRAASVRALPRMPGSHRWDPGSPHWVFHSGMSASTSVNEAGFVGRDTELDVLADCARQADAGIPWLVLVEGEAGIGKTTLIRQMLERLDGFAVWWAGCDQTEQDWPFSVIEQWLRRADPRLVTDAGPTLAGLSPTVSPMQVGAELLALIGTVEETTPLVLVVDDVPWCDGASLKALGFVLRRLWADRVLVLATARTDDPQAPSADDGEWRRLSAGLQHTRSLRLTGLSLEQTHALARTALPENADGLDAASVHRLWEHTAGHPLYLRSLLTDPRYGALASPGAPLPVPATLAASVTRNLEQLPLPARRLVEALAVLDAQVPLALAGQLADLDDPADALEPLLRCGLVEWSPGEPSSPVRIAHALQRDAVYQALPPADRRALHTAAAALVDADSAWTHKVTACDHADPELARALETEADRQQQAGNIPRAASLLLWAADLSPTRALYEQRLLRAAARMNAVTFSEPREALALVPRVEQCAPCALRTCLLARHAHWREDYPASVLLARQALAEAEREGDPAILARARAWLGLAEHATGHYALGAALLARALHEDGAEPDVLDEARHSLGQVTTFTEGPHAALRVIDELAQLSESPDVIVRHDASLLVTRAHALQILGAKAALRSAQTALEAPGATTMQQSWARAWLAIAQCNTGRWEQGTANMERALTEAEIGRRPLLVTVCHAVLTCYTAWQGRWAEAQAHADACIDDGTAGNRPAPAIARAFLASARGDYDALYAALQPLADEAWRTPPLRPWLTVFWTQWPLALIGTGRLDEAEAAIAQLKHLADAAPAYRLILAERSGQLAETRGDLRTADRIYQHALAVAAGEDDPAIELAGLEACAGRVRAALGDRLAGTELLHRAHQRYTAMGLAIGAANVAEELTACGTPTAPSPSLTIGAELTERELAAASLAAKGLTNQEIARELYVSPKTVEYHLGHVYAKLQLTSRRQLRTTLTPA
jgi:ATP/maltotriose-dependent transcriptional regulator MalT